jgi:hypothetical protein
VYRSGCIKRVRGRGGGFASALGLMKTNTISDEFETI